MRILVLAGLFSLAALPAAYAAEATEECQLDESRRAARERLDTTTLTQQPAAAPATNVAQREGAEAGARAEPIRRRSGKRIPDAELIGPRGAL